MIRAIMLGAGNRGLNVYGDYSLNHPEEIRFIAVAEPDEQRRTRFASLHQIDVTLQFETAEDILKQQKCADALFICTHDKLHIDQVLKGLRLGYHVFMEKPIAIKPKDLIRVEKQQHLYKRKLVVGHVLRYAHFFTTLKKIIDEKQIGDITAMTYTENVGYQRYAHAYVRGNWKDDTISSPMLLSKSCHDMDIICYLLDQKPRYVSSFGDLSHFKKETSDHFPAHCMDGCPIQDHCVYEASRVYLQANDMIKYAVSNDISDDAIKEALKKGPYGRCVYRSSNNVVDHQTVQI